MATANQPFTTGEPVTFPLTGADAKATRKSTGELMGDLGIEPAPCTPEALALLQAEGIAPRPAPGEPLGPDDERFSPIAIGHFTHRLLDVRRLLEQLTAEQKSIHETLRLARWRHGSAFWHLRGEKG